MTNNVTVVDHPFVQHKLTIMRDKTTPSADFRRLLGEISLLLAYEVTRDYPTQLTQVETPVATGQFPMLRGEELVLISVLRAGNGILDGILKLIPTACVGHIGLYRDPDTYEAVEYYFKVPQNMEKRDVIVVDPMLATGHSAAAAIDRIKKTKPKSLKFLCLLAAPEGIAYLTEAHPDVAIFTAAIDQKLNDKKYITPGLGDAGDRMFGTQ